MTSSVPLQWKKASLAPAERAARYVAWALGIGLVLVPLLSCFHFTNHRIGISFEGFAERISFYLTYLAAVMAGYGVYLDTRSQNQRQRNLFTGSVFLLMTSIVAHVFGLPHANDFPIVGTWAALYFFFTCCGVLAAIKTQRWGYWGIWWVSAQMYACFLFFLIGCWLL